MSIGTSVPLPAYTIDPAFMAKKAEELGFESIWYAEHPAVPVHSSSPFPSTGGEIPWTYSHFTDPYIALARASGVTSTIKLGTGITLVPERNPLLLAKEIASLDLFSGGRFLFGIGTGWLRDAGVPRSCSCCRKRRGNAPTRASERAPPRDERRGRDCAASHRSFRRSEGRGPDRYGPGILLRWRHPRWPEAPAGPRPQPG